MYLHNAQSIEIVKIAMKSINLAAQKVWGWNKLSGVRKFQIVTIIAIANTLKR